MWLAIHLPGLALQVYARALDAELPLAVSDGGRLVAVNARACALGLQPGLGDGAARTLVAALRILPRRPRAERAALSRLATWALGFSDLVSLATADDLDRHRGAARPTLRQAATPAPVPALVLEVGRSLRLFGGAPALHRQVDAGLVGLGWQADTVIAPTPAGALLLAAAGHHGLIPDHDALRQALAALPPAALGLDRQGAADLTAMGIGSIGDLLRLPRAGLALRLGLGRLAQLERLLGERADPRCPFVPPARFHAQLELPAEVPDAPALVFACRRLIDDLGGYLHAHQGGVQRLAWRLEHADQPATRFHLGSARPERDPERWLSLLRERLERLALPAPVRAIGLASEPVRPLPATPRPLPGLPPAAGAGASQPPSKSKSKSKSGSGSVSGSEPDSEPAPTDSERPGTAPDPALLDRLRARLGDDAIRGLALHPDHRPERAWAWTAPGIGPPSIAPPSIGPSGIGPHGIDPGTTLGPTPTDSPDTMTDPDATANLARADRPLWLLPQPRPLRQHGHRPWLDGPLDLGTGCERIDTGWWDGFEVARDYYVATTIHGERLWIYRDLHGDCGWFLHGWFG